MMNKISGLITGLIVLLPLFAYSFPLKIKDRLLSPDSLKIKHRDTLPAATPRHTEQITPGSNFQESSLRNQKKTPGQRYRKLSPGTYLFAISPKSVLRRQPSINSDILKVLNPDTKLIFIDRQVSWFKVKVAETGQIGYIHQYMVK